LHGRGLEAHFPCRGPEGPSQLAIPVSVKHRIPSKSGSTGK
jgi:hypothetical protein